MACIHQHHQTKATLALRVAQTYHMQSRLSDAFPYMQRAQQWLHLIHCQGYTALILHAANGMYALACGDMDTAQVDFNIALHLLRESPTDINPHLARIRLARVELCHHSPNSCLALIQGAELFSPPALLTPTLRLLRADRCIFVQELKQAMAHTILTLVLGKTISDDSYVAAAFQRLGDLYIMTDKDFTSAITSYHVSMDRQKYAGKRRHVADCVLRFGIVMLLKGKLAGAKHKFMNSRHIYELAEDAQGYNYCEAVLAECEIEGPKVSLAAMPYSSTQY